jgi:predicted transporter
MNKENAKKFWKEHKETIKKTVIIAVVPVPVIVGIVLLNKIVDKRNEEIFNILEQGYNVK